MKYDHMVKVNGKYYPSGTEVPEGIGTETKEVWDEFSKEENDDNAKYYEEQSKLFEQEAGRHKYTKTDINRMSITELQNTAKSIGIDGADGMTGKELKERLLNAFGL